MTISNAVLIKTKRSTWKPVVLLPEIPATRFSCFSGSLRPKLGLFILFIVLVSAFGLGLFHVMNNSVSASSAQELRHKDEVESIVRGHLSFSRNLYQALLSASTRSNSVLSSYSLGSVLTMAAMGAKSSTLNQIKSVLELPEDDEKIQLAFSDINAALGSNENYTLENANAIFTQENQEIKPKFSKILEEKFRSELREVDFTKSEEARKIINDWVSDKTKTKISELFPSGSLQSMTKLVLVNAIYFKGDWAQKFKKELTEAEDFYVSSDRTVKVPMMHSSDIKFGYTQLTDLRASLLEMPYKGERISMCLILPDKDVDFTEMENNLHKFNINSLKGMIQKTKVKVTIPKFKIESFTELRKPLEKLGLTDMFSSKADFSEIAGQPGDLYVSSVVQKAVIEVNEEGSEAAAASGMVIMMRSMPILPTFTVNRPFYFFIHDKLTGFVLFSGRVIDPSI